MRKLRKFERELLAEGNTYSFARLVFELHEDICKEADFTFQDVCADYRARTECNGDIFTLWGKNGVKYFFDTEMNFRGTAF